jgi:hypothetical protein
MAYTGNKRDSFSPGASHSNVIWHELGSRDSVPGTTTGTGLDHRIQSGSTTHPTSSAGRGEPHRHSMPSTGMRFHLLHEDE